MMIISLQEREENAMLNFNEGDRMRLEFSGRSDNESFARMVVAAFSTKLNPTLDEISDVKTAVSEAVTNSIVHGYENENGIVVIECEIQDRTITVVVQDYGVGIEDIKQAMEPLYTSKPELERSGMGFSFMEAFMDEIEVESKKGEGTRITMKKTISCKMTEASEVSETNSK